MSDVPRDEGGFAALFEQQGKGPKRKRSVKIGERIEVTVAQVTKDAVFVDLDEKCQAWIEAVELAGTDGKVTVKPGDRVTVHVVEIDDRSGTVKLGRSLGKTGDLLSLEIARDQRVPVEGKVTAVNKGGAEVDIHGMRAFCPLSQLDLKFVQDTASYVGRTLQFRVTEIREGGRSVVLSRRAVLEAEAREATARMLEKLLPGTVITGTVSGVRDFGVFVDLGGAEGLVPSSELSHDHQVRPSDVVKLGDVIEVQVKEIKSDGANTKITLSLKALSADPWTALDVLAPIGKVISGTVTRLADFGAFVRLAAGIEGLLHISELGSRIEHPSKVLAVGQTVLVVVKATDAAQRKVSLSLSPDGASEGSVASGASLVVGAIVKVKVERIESYGIFVQVHGTRARAARGLVPNTELGVMRGADVRKLFPEGTELMAKVLETGEGRLRFSLRAIKDDEERAAYEGYQHSTRAGAMGKLGDLLKNRKL